jgi:hypothetical protein
MNKLKKTKANKEKIVDLKIGEGFNDLRGDIPEIGPIPKFNGQNINNEPRGLEERNAEKAKRR